MSHAAREHNVQPSQASSFRSATLEGTADVNDSWPLPRGLFPILPTSPVTPTPDHHSNSDSYAPFEEPPVETHLRSPTAYFKRQRQQQRRRQLLRQQNNNQHHHQQLNSGSDHGGMNDQKHVHANPQQRSLIGVRHADSYTAATKPTSSPRPIPWPMPNRLPSLNTIDDDKSNKDDADKHEQQEESRLNIINSAVLHSPTTDSTLLDSHHLLSEQQQGQLLPSPQSQPLALRPLPSVDLSTDDSFHTPPESANEDSGFNAALNHISRIYPTTTAAKPAPPTVLEPMTQDKSDSIIDHVSLKSKSTTHLPSPASSSSSAPTLDSDSDSVVDVVDLFADDSHITHEENRDETLLVNLIGQSHKSNRTTTPRIKGPGDTSFLNIEGLRSLFSDDNNTPQQYAAEYITKKKKKNLRRSHSDLSPPSQQSAMMDSNDLPRSSSTQQMNHNSKRRHKNKKKKKKKKQHSNPLTDTAYEEYGHTQQTQHNQDHHHHGEVFPSNAIPDTSIPGAASISPLAQDSYQPFSSPSHHSKYPEMFSNHCSPTNSKPPLPPSSTQGIPNTSISHDTCYDTPTIISDTRASTTPSPNDLPPIVMMSSLLTGNDPALLSPQHNDNPIHRQTAAASQHLANETGTPRRQGDQHLLGKTGVIVRDVPNRPPYHGIRRAETGFIMSRAELQLDDPPDLFFRDNPNPKSLAYFQPAAHPYDDYASGSMGSSPYDASPPQQRLIKDEYSSSTSGGESNGTSSGSQQQTPQNSPTAAAQASHAFQHQHGTGLPTNTGNGGDENVSQSLAHLSVAANAGSITPTTDTALDMSKGSTMAGSSGVGRVTGSSGGGGGSGWGLRRRSDDTTAGSGSNVGLVSKLSSGIRRAARRAMPKRTGGVDGSSQQHDSVSSPRLAVGSPKNKAAAADLVLSGCSVDEAVCRITYVCRQRLGCQVNVRDSGKKIKVQQQQQQLIDNDEHVLSLKLSIFLSKLHDDEGVRLKIKQTKAEAEQCNITTLWEFYSKLEKCLQETEHMGNGGGGPVVVGI